MSETGNGRRLRSRALVYVVVLLPYFGVGVLSVRVAGEQARTTKQLQVDCPFYGVIAGAPLPPDTSELGRRLVRASVDSYNKRGCQQITGPLPTPTSVPSTASSP